MAWQATIGYINMHHSPNAMLKLQVYPTQGGLRWNATVSWAQHQEQVIGQPTLPDTLRELWRVVDQNHQIFLTEEDAIRRPANYDDMDWLDVPTQDILHRLIWTTQSAFPDDWTLILVYQPVDNPDLRVQGRLLARDNGVQVGGRGGSLQATCHELYRNAVRVYSSAQQKPDHE